MSVRKRTWTILGGAVALALTVTAASAEEEMLSANYWLPRCKAFVSGSARELLGQGICAGRVEGLGFASCPQIPDSVTRQQIVLVVVRYIEARPQRMHESFLVLAAQALRDAWPCRK
jgi:hypothetical protein